MAVMDRVTRRGRRARKERKLGQKAGYYLDVNDWPTHVPSPNIPLHRSARVLNRFDNLMPQAMEELREVKPLKESPDDSAEQPSC